MFALISWNNFEFLGNIKVGTALKRAPYLSSGNWEVKVVDWSKWYADLLLKREIKTHAISKSLTICWQIHFSIEHKTSGTCSKRTKTKRSFPPSGIWKPRTIETCRAMPTDTQRKTKWCRCTKESRIFIVEILLRSFAPAQFCRFKIVLSKIV